MLFEQDRVHQSQEIANGSIDSDKIEYRFRRVLQPRAIYKRAFSSLKETNYYYEASYSHSLLPKYHEDLTVLEMVIIKPGEQTATGLRSMSSSHLTYTKAPRKAFTDADRIPSPTLSFPREASTPQYITRCLVVKSP